MVAIVALERGIWTVIKDGEKYSISVDILKRLKSHPITVMIRLLKSPQTNSTDALLFFNHSQTKQRQHSIQPDFFFSSPWQRQRPRQPRLLDISIVPVSMLAFRMTNESISRRGRALISYRWHLVITRPRPLTTEFKLTSGPTCSSRLFIV